MIRLKNFHASPIFLSSVAAALCALLYSHRAQADVPIVVGGKPVATIVHNSAGGGVTSLAVKELREHVKLMTGAELPVIMAKDWDGGGEGGFLIVGQGTALDTLGVELGDLPPEGFRIVTLPQRPIVVLAGRDSGNPLGTPAVFRLAQEFGSLYAVYELLERWGVRWLFSGELGTVAPRRQELSVDDLDFTSSPDFRMRNHWLRSRMPDGETVQRSDLRSDDPARREVAHRDILWALRNRAGNSLSTYRAGHHSPGWWDMWSDKHPEYIGLYRGQRGIRRSAPGKVPDSIIRRSKLCVGHPDTAGAVASLAIKAFSGSTALRSYSICEQDGSPGFCECPLCMALDVYEGEETVANVPLTDRYVNFWNRVAEKVAVEFPDRYLGAYVYARYNELPRREKKLHPLIHAIFVANEEVEPKSLRRRIEGWSKISPNPLALYTHPMLGAWPVLDFSSSAFPALTLGNVVEGLRFVRSLNVVGFITDGGSFASNTVGSHGLLAYAYARWLWNADLSPDEIVADFTEHGFGAGAEEMRLFFSAIDKRQLSFPREDGRGAWLEHHLQVFTPEFVKQCMGHLDRATGLADDENERARIDIFRRNLDYTSAELELERLRRRFEAGDCTLEELREAFKRCDDIYENLPAETKPFKPMYNRGEAARVVELATKDTPLSVLPFTGWEMRADPFNQGLAQEWQKKTASEGWQKVTSANYDMQGLQGSDLPVWYRVAFNVPEGAVKERLKIGFSVNNTSADIYLNGGWIGSQIMGESHYREPAFGGAGELVPVLAEGAAEPIYDISRHVSMSQGNLLMVRIWGYTDRGVLCRDAWLLESRQ